MATTLNVSTLVRSLDGQQLTREQDSKEQLDYLQNNPKKYLEYRKQIENDLNQRFEFVIKGSSAANDAREVAYSDMERHLRDDPRLVDKVSELSPSCLSSN